MDKTEFLNELSKIQSYNDLHSLVVECNMPNVAAEALGLPKETFRNFIRAVDRLDISIQNLKTDYERLLGEHKDDIENYLAERKIEYRASKLVDIDPWDCDDWEDYDDYYHPRNGSLGRHAARAKNLMLVADYEAFKDAMCGRIGQRRVKLLLNRLSKNGDEVAGLYRLILEIENVNINAKKYRNTSRHNYKDNLYAEKERLLVNLMEGCDKYNENHPDVPAVYGKQDSDVYAADYVLYFDLPGVEQISFHTNLSGKQLENVPRYKGEWDGKVNSTLGKVEAAVNSRYSAELEVLRTSGERKRARAGASSNNNPPQFFGKGCFLPHWT